MWTCPGCGAVNGDKYKRCDECGLLRGLDPAVFREDDSDDQPPRRRRSVLEWVGTGVAITTAAVCVLGLLLNGHTKEAPTASDPTTATATATTGCKTHWEMHASCEEQVRSMLKAPSEAEFPGILDTRIDVNPVTCVNTWSSWVDAPNSFNANVRSQFVCTFDPGTGSLNVSFTP